MSNTEQIRFINHYIRLTDNLINEVELAIANNRQSCKFPRDLKGFLRDRLEARAKIESTLKGM